MFHSTSKIRGADAPGTSRGLSDRLPPSRTRRPGGGWAVSDSIGSFEQYFWKPLSVDLECKCAEISTSREILENLRAYLEVVHRPRINDSRDLHYPFATLVSSIINVAGAPDFRYIQNAG